jgi:hypothetical protein
VTITANSRPPALSGGAVGDDHRTRCRIDFDHRQPTAFGGQCVPGPGVGLLLDPEFVDLRLPALPIGDLWKGAFTPLASLSCDLV